MKYIVKKSKVTNTSMDCTMSRQLIFPHVSSQIATYLYLKNLTGT
jgi:hypothetical protein